ncbi:nitroreductase family protein [Phocaeicola sp.]|uniref:nitroreductase family protein n=1 Tax=Phocaeicola sp. TaxID=2773926 RepID=UPI00307BCD3A
MDILELIKYRRSIRRYTDKQVPEEDLLKVLEAGAYAPNAGGGQRSRFVACQDKALNDTIGNLMRLASTAQDLQEVSCRKNNRRLSMTRPSVPASTEHRPSSRFSDRRTFSTPCPMPSVPRRTWCSKPRHSVSHRAFWRGARRHSPLPKVKKSYGTGAYPTQ